MPVEVVGEERNGRVDGDHEQYTDDVPLLPWFEVVSAMPPDKVPRHEHSDQAENSGDDEAYMMKLYTLPDCFFFDCFTNQHLRLVPEEGGRTYCSHALSWSYISANPSSRWYPSR